MWLIKESCRERDVQSLRKIRAQIFAFLSRVLEESNEEAISMIIRKSDFGSALGMISHSILYKISTYIFDRFGGKFKLSLLSFILQIMPLWLMMPKLQHFLP